MDTDSFDSESFENWLYTLLTSGPVIIFIEDESFWEPIKIGLTDNELNKLTCAYTHKKECLICRDERRLYKVVHCCKNMMCTECAENWFNESVYCPFCKQDQRNYQSNKSCVTDTGTII